MKGDYEFYSPLLPSSSHPRDLRERCVCILFPPLFLLHAWNIKELIIQGRRNPTIYKVISTRELAPWRDQGAFDQIKPRVDTCRGRTRMLLQENF